MEKESSAVPVRRSFHDNAAVASCCFDVVHRPQTPPDSFTLQELLTFLREKKAVYGFVEGMSVCAHVSVFGQGYCVLPKAPAPMKSVESA